MLNTMNSTKRTRSFKSSMSKSRHSLSHQASYFNPLRFLAMGLIEKNQERKEHERKNQQDASHAAQTKDEAEKLALQ